MKIFLKKIIGFLIFFFIFSILCLFLSTKIAYEKIAQKGRAVVIDKNHRLDCLPSPKIILVGGSNVCYGINSKIIEDSLKMPVVDMSINANMGMVFYLNQIKHSLNKGDIVIGIPEYAAYNGENMQGNSGIYALGIIEKKNFNFLTPFQWLNFPLYTGDLVKDNYTALFASSRKTKINMGRFLYNKYGDYVGHERDTSHSSSFRNDKIYNLNIQENKLDHRFVDLLSSFSKFAQEKGCHYMQAFPVYSKTFFSKNYALQIHDALPGIKWLGTPEQYLYGFEDLYDSPNHLIYNKVDERTLKLVKDLKMAINNQP